MGSPTEHGRFLKLFGLVDNDGNLNVPPKMNGAVVRGILEGKILAQAKEPKDANGTERKWAYRDLFALANMDVDDVIDVSDLPLLCKRKFERVTATIQGLARSLLIKMHPGGRNFKTCWEALPDGDPLPTRLFNGVAGKLSAFTSGLSSMVPWGDSKSVSTDVPVPEANESAIPPNRNQ